MAKTFETDHVTMHAPSIRVSEEIPIDKHKIVRYDVRFKKPYIDEILYPATMHSIQHMMKAAFAEVSKVKIIILWITISKALLLSPWIWIMFPARQSACAGITHTMISTTQSGRFLNFWICFMEFD